MARTVVTVCADIVEQFVEEGVVITSLRKEAEGLGINVSTVIDMAEELYALATEEVEDTFDND